MIKADMKIDCPLKQDLFLKVRAYVQFFRKSKNRQNSAKFGKKSKKFENILNSQERMA